MKFILGRKIGMTRIFDDEGRHVAVTKVQMLPATVSLVKTKEADGYKAVQIVTPHPTKKDRIVKKCEFREDNLKKFKIGDAIIAGFKKDELVTVTGTGKGKGFAGTIKRHGFHRGPETHGSNNVREPGSIGGGYPQRVLLGRRMPGRMGNETVTIKNLKIVDVLDDMLLIAGSIPGPAKSIIRIFGKGEKAEEEVDHTAEEEERAKQAMLEADKEAKAEEKTGAENKPEEAKTEDGAEQA